MRKSIRPTTRQELDEFVRKINFRPYGVMKYRGRDIFIAESDYLNDDPSYVWGYYRTAWFVTKKDSEEKMEIGRFIEFESMHDKDAGWTKEAKRQARIETAIADAQKWIDNCKTVGHY